MPDAPVSSASAGRAAARATAVRGSDALADPVAAAVLGCRSVAELSAGPFGTVGTYLPGRRVPGVQITDTEVTIRVVAHVVPLHQIETEVRAAVTAVVGGLPVHLGIDDVVTD